MSFPRPGELSLTQRLVEGFHLIDQEDPLPATYEDALFIPRDMNLPDLQRPSWAKEKRT